MNNKLKRLFPKDNFINCPYPDCEEILNETNLEESENMIECHFSHRFCKVCRIKEDHAFEKCNQVRMILKLS